MSLIARALAQFPRKTIRVDVHGTEPTAPAAPVDALDVLVNDPLQNPRALTREEYAAALRRHDLAMTRFEWTEKSYVPPHIQIRHAGEALRHWHYAATAVGSRSEQMREAEARLAAEAYRRR